MENLSLSINIKNLFLFFVAFYIFAIHRDRVYNEKIMFVREIAMATLLGSSAAIIRVSCFGDVTITTIIYRIF